MGQGLSCGEGADYRFLGAVEDGDVDLVEAMLEEEPSLLEQRGGNGRLPALHLAAAKGRIEVGLCFSWLISWWVLVFFGNFFVGCLSVVHGVVMDRCFLWFWLGLSIRMSWMGRNRWYFVLDQCLFRHGTLIFPFLLLIGNAFTSVLVFCFFLSSPPLLWIDFFCLELI